MAKLVVLSEGFTGRSIELKGEKISIGRLDDNAFQIEEPSVSSHHCEVFMRGSEVVAKDLNSTNGTFISGEKISEAVLKPGQILRLGQVDIRLEAGAPAAAEKKKIDHTMVLPQGVKLNDLEQAGKTINIDKNSPFAKKSNKANLIFIAVLAVLGVAIVVFVVLAFMKMGEQ